MFLSVDIHRGNGQLQPIIWPSNTWGHVFYTRVFNQSKLVIIFNWRKYRLYYIIPATIIVYIVCLMALTATFNNISAMLTLWRSVLLVEQTGGPGENHRSVASHWQILSHTVCTSIFIPHIFCDFPQSRPTIQVLYIFIRFI